MFRVVDIRLAKSVEMIHYIVLQSSIFIDIIFLISVFEHCGDNGKEYFVMFAMPSWVLAVAGVNPNRSFEWLCLQCRHGFCKVTMKTMAHLNNYV